MVMWKRESSGENLNTDQLGREEIIALLQATHGTFEP